MTIKNDKKKNILGGIGNSVKALAVKTIEKEFIREKVKSYAQHKLPKIDLENFSELSTKLAQTVKGFSTISDQIFSHLGKIQTDEHASQETLNKAAQLNAYQQFFKNHDILVDADFYLYLEKNHLLEEQRLDSEQLLIQYFEQQIKRDEIELGSNLSDEQVGVFVESLIQLLKHKNWIGAALCLHTYIDLLSQQLFRDFTPKDKAQLEAYLTAAPKAKFAKRDRLVLANNLKGVEEYHANISSEAADKLIPLVFVQLACATYDRFPAQVSRNSLIHFNSNVAFTEIDPLYVYKHLQIAKVLEQQLPLNKQLIFEVLEDMRD